MVDRPQIVPIDQTFGRWQQNNGRWPQAMADEIWDGQQAIPYSSKAKHKCLVQNQTQNRQVERSRGKARSRDLWELKTITNMDNHRVFKQWRLGLEAGQKWGVYSCPSFTELESHNNDGSECQSPETTHFWQGRRLRQSKQDNKDMCSKAGAKCNWQCKKPSITYDHAKKSCNEAHTMQ